MDKDNKLNIEDISNVAGGGDAAYGQRITNETINKLEELIRDIGSNKPTEQQKATLKNYEGAFVTIKLNYGSDKYVEDTCNQALNSIAYYLGR